MAVAITTFYVIVIPRVYDSRSALSSSRMYWVGGVVKTVRGDSGVSCFGGRFSY
jgi:hypothetical protein